MELVRSSVSIVSGLPYEKVRSAPAIVVSGPAQRSLTLENPDLRYWIAGYGIEKFHPITERSEFSDHLAGAVLP